MSPCSICSKLHQNPRLLQRCSLTKGAPTSIWNFTVYDRLNIVENLFTMKMMLKTLFVWVCLFHTCEFSTACEVHETSSSHRLFPEALQQQAHQIVSTDSSSMDDSARSFLRSNQPDDHLSRSRILTDKLPKARADFLQCKANRLAVLQKLLSVRERNGVESAVEHKNPMKKRKPSKSFKMLT